MLNVDAYSTPVFPLFRFYVSVSLQIKFIISITLCIIPPSLPPQCLYRQGVCEKVLKNPSSSAKNV